jgi:hypothetical protein
MAHTHTKPDMSYAYIVRPSLTYDWNGNADMEVCGAQFSDVEIASKVRMLMRTDLNHEAVCVMARDRIMGLSKEVARLSNALARDGGTK